MMRVMFKQWMQLLKIFKTGKCYLSINQVKDTEVFGMKNNALEAGFIQVPKVCAVNFYER